jgi:CHAD domain-containing protein
MAYRFAVGTVDVSKLNPAVLSIHLLALLEKVSARAGIEDVHRLRTTVRRLEVQLGDPPARIARPLKSLRRRAGKVRDLDVHLGLLKPPLLSTQPQEKLQDKLRQILKDKRARQLGKLRARVAKAAPLLESRLPALVERTSHAAAALHDARQQAARARQQFLQWTQEIPADEAGLHQLRIQTKKLRYSLEPLLAHEEAAALVAKFKQVQDAIGKWHDWVTLEQLAARYLDPAAESAPLSNALHAHCEREYRHARRTAQTVRSWLSRASATGGPGASGRSGVRRRVPGAKPSGGPYPTRAAAGTSLKLIRKAG